jgi:hypothetical protein
MLYRKFKTPIPTGIQKTVLETSLKFNIKGTDIKVKSTM